MDRFITEDTGYPVDIETVNFINTMVKHPTEALAAAVGDNTIISGVVDDGTNISAGYIVYGGELLAFKSGASQDRFEVVTVINDGYYDNGSAAALPVSEERFAQPTADGSAVLLNSLKRLTPQRDKAILVEMGGINISFIDGISDVATFYGLIINVEREIYRVNNARYKVTIPAVAGSFIPLLTFVGDTHSPIGFKIVDVTTNTFYIQPDNLSGEDGFHANLILKILK